MPLRKDPMAAAAQAISAIEAICTGQPRLVAAGNSNSSSSSSSSSSSGAAALAVEGEALMCTVGRLHVYPNQV
jgi:hypothetical protein